MTSSVAKTLGATRVAERAFQWTKEHNIISDTCTDKEAVNACEQFASKFFMPLYRVLHLYNDTGTTYQPVRNDGGVSDVSNQRNGTVL